MVEHKFSPCTGQYLYKMKICTKFVPQWAQGCQGATVTPEPLYTHPVFAYAGAKLIEERESQPVFS